MANKDAEWIIIFKLRDGSILPSAHEPFATLQIACEYGDTVLQHCGSTFAGYTVYRAVAWWRSK